jgi:hypothetical protein
LARKLNNLLTKTRALCGLSLARIVKVKCQEFVKKRKKEEEAGALPRTLYR